jgi:hypothetical protein
VAVVEREITAVAVAVVAYYLELLQQHQEYYLLQPSVVVVVLVDLEMEYWQQQGEHHLLCLLTYLYHVQVAVVAANSITALVKAELLVVVELHLALVVAVAQLQHVQ